MSLKSLNHKKPGSTKVILLETPPKEEPHHISRNMGVVNHTWLAEAVLDSPWIPWEVSVLTIAGLKHRPVPDDFSTQPLQMTLHCNFQMIPLSSVTTSKSPKYRTLSRPTLAPLL